jgi:hypothetical protein
MQEMANIPTKKIIASLRALPAKSSEGKTAKLRSDVKQLALDLLPTLEQKKAEGYTFLELSELVVRENNLNISPKTFLYYVSSLRSKQGQEKRKNLVSTKGSKEQPIGQKPQGCKKGT